MHAPRAQKKTELFLLRGWFFPSGPATTLLMAGRYDPNRIRRARLDTGLQAQELAEKLGITRGHLSRIENDKSECGDKLAKRIAALCGVEFWTLYRGVPQEAILSEVERDLLVRFRRLPPTDQGRLLGYLDAMPAGYGDVMPLTPDEICQFRTGLRERLLRAGLISPEQTSASPTPGEPPSGRFHREPPHEEADAQ